MNAGRKPTVAKSEYRPNAPRAFINYRDIAQTLIARSHRSKHNQQKASIWFIAGLQSFGTDPSHMTMQTSEP